MEDASDSMSLPIAVDDPYEKALPAIPPRKLTVLPLIFLIFFEVSGGPIGTEQAVQAGGALLALLGFLIFPFIWSVPEALVTAEMATAFPENGGYVLWTSAAFGPFWGFLQGWWKWTSGMINNATYPILCLDYLQSILPAVGSGWGRIVGRFVFTGLLTYLNYRGLTIVGWSAVTLGIVCLLPFAIMIGFAIPRLEPSRWLGVDLQNVDWRNFSNILFWNLNFWDNASTLAGEVEQPERAFPKAILTAGVLVGLSYFLPLLAGIGAFEVVRSEWDTGFYSLLAKRLGGWWLQWWMELGAMLSCVGLFAAQMSSSSFQVLGMADMGILPAIFSSRSSYNTPYIGILLSAVGALLLSFLSFEDVIQSANALYSYGMLLEFFAFIWLRVTKPDQTRPFRIPLGTFGVIAMCVPPCALLIFVVTLSSLKVIVLSCVLTVGGLLLYVCLHYTKRKKWMRFLETYAAEGKAYTVQEKKGGKQEEAGLLRG
ncbi:hypothetical protein GOP47_0016441 [Adiantum capillus-veneris]|uniref:Uncharacterized protein n=1 Tax=Adiantum capillus-veneris TaxID=13818 RepID=A0A9D4ZCZ3_ADICA|nr:hypothetical protein GOP47_0016441 [Adiantum capillus-veneris]